MLSVAVEGGEDDGVGVFEVLELGVLFVMLLAMALVHQGEDLGQRDARERGRGRRL
jgi:hypothetical protein